jgi:hypothetical protein
MRPWPCVDEHGPYRPQWICEPCDTPWPCDTARVGLREMYASDPVGLATHMNLLLPYVAREAPAPAEELHERFLAWTK